jgi:ATP/maltotriose-dependent transcriptional regulator MalT/DNA-binding SARP family transcriptional activator
VSLLTAGRISRPALARRIADGLEAGSVTLVAGAGFGKTMALEEAVELAGRKTIWLACGDARGDAGRLLTNTVQGLRTAVPGLVDVVGDALAGSRQQLDVEAATSALLAELEHLLVEPLAIVFDDAEALQGNERAIAMLDQLLGVRGAPLSLAIASRQPLPIRVSKLRAAGRLLEIGPAELSFTASECAELLRERHGEEVSEEEIETVIAASEGWPMGIALARLDGPGPEGGAGGREDLFLYLAEEVFDHLDSEDRSMLADSSVVDVLTPELARDLGLPAEVAEVAEAAGLPVRTHPSGARSYHPLILGFLRERLAELRTGPELAALHERAGDSLAAAGLSADAIEHWLEAGRFERALSAMAPDGAGLVRSSPETVSRWLAAMPAELRTEPDYLLLQGQQLWGGGDHERAVEPLRAAIAGFHEAGNADGEWLARVFLADTLTFIGEFEEVEPLTDGWEEASGPLAGAASSSVAWYQAIALASLGRIDEAERLKERLRQDSGTARLFGFLDAITSGGTALASGDVEATLRFLTAEIRELEVHDPLGSLPYVMGMLLATRRNLGERRDALEWVERCEREAERVGLGFAVRDFRLQRATLLAQSGDLARAEAVLAQATKRGGTGWREVFDAEAEAHVSMLRGDADAAVEAARRALDAATTAPITWRVLTTVEMVELLAHTGAPDSASAATETTLRWLDERFPGKRGRLPRAWLLAASASLRYRAGEPEEAFRTLSDAWDAAGGAAAAMLRARWQTVQPVLWQALAEGAITPERVLPAMQEAFPGGQALAALSGHPEPAVRRAAVLSGLAARHPDAIGRLSEFAEDPDEQIAAAATAAMQDLQANPPPLRFELLGRFRVLRAGWELDEESWKRPIAARVVRFLLIQESRAIPEDALFEAFWAGKPADAARQNLAAAISRARKVLDLPGAPESIIELRERTYRLRLGERDSTDVMQFESAARDALAERGDGRRASLEHAAALWIGEPLPEDRYAEWSFGWRERLVEAYSGVLSALIETYVASGEDHEAIRAARRLLEMDPLNEDAHRQLMLTYARTGRTSQALRQFLECRRALVVELGVEPSAETSRLQARILAGERV